MFVIQDTCSVDHKSSCNKCWLIHLFQVTKNDDIDLSLEDEDETDNIRLPPPKMSINIKSSDPLNVTMTKSCLESLTNLGKVWTSFVFLENKVLLYYR